MNKKKLSHLPINLIDSIWVLFLSDVFIQNIVIIPEWKSILISFMIYTADAFYRTDIDYLTEEIEELKKK